MRALDLDFIGRSRNRRRKRRGVILLLLSCTLAAYIGASYYKANQQLAATTAELQRQRAANRQTEPVAVTAEQTEQIRAEIKQANKIIAKLALPWDELFRIVESSVDENTTLIALEPDAERGEVQITVEARNLAAMLDYVKRLQESPALKDVHVASHQIQQQDPQRPVRFVVSAKWDHDNAVANSYIKAKQNP